MHYRTFVHLQVAAAVLVIAAVAGTGWRVLEPVAGSPVTALLRLSWAYAAPLAAATLAMMFERAASPDFILGYRAAHARPSARTAILQNTTEQTVLGFLALAAFAGQAPAALTGILPAAAGLFVAGRVLFAAGYLLSPMWRFFGFSLNFYASLALLAAAAWLAIRR